MNKFLPALFLSLITFTVSAQRFSQYNTGSLYDSFENPAQRAFIPDSSRTMAFNFLFPTVGSNTLLTGNAQNLLLQRGIFFNYNVNPAYIDINNTKANHVITNNNVYELMFKVFTSVDGDQELGISAQTKVNGRGSFTDGAAALFSNRAPFANGTTYYGLLNTNSYYQAYHEISFSYREKINKQLALGVKLNGILGIAYNKLEVDRSGLQYSTEGQSVVGMQGRFYSSYVPGKFTKHDLLPNFRNPGASVSIGVMLHTQDGFVLQWNVKDLGFIHWSKHSQLYDFGYTSPVKLTASHREDSVAAVINRIVQYSTADGSFNTPSDGRAEFSAARTFAIADNEDWKYTPTLVLSKELFYQGMEGALVNHIHYRNAIISLTGMYNDLRIFTFGTQFMIKSPNVDFFIGSDALTQSLRTAREGIRKNEDLISQNPAFTNASFYLGFAIKFGNVIEHPMNSSTIPTGEKGFFGRLYGRLFKTDR